jgi:hypothetical protein
MRDPRFSSGAGFRGLEETSGSAAQRRGGDMFERASDRGGVLGYSGAIYA